MKKSEKPWVESRDEDYYIDQELDFAVNCSLHRPDQVLQMMPGWVADRDGAKYYDLNRKTDKALIGYWWFTVKLLKAPREFTHEEAVEFAKSRFVGGKGVLPGQVAMAFADKFPRAVMIGRLCFAGGIWKNFVDAPDLNARSQIVMRQGYNGDQDVLECRNEDHAHADGDILPVILAEGQMKLATRKGGGNYA